MKQKTIKGSFSLFGKGLHTGLNLTVTFLHLRIPVIRFNALTWKVNLSLMQ